MQQLFDRMMNSLSMMTEEGMLEECMSMNPKILKSVPIRYKVICMAFLQKMSLQELNDKLEDTDCERLYSRNYKEAGLMYAFIHGLSYKEWQKLSLKSNQCIDFAIDKRIYQGKKLTLQAMRDYVEKQSEKLQDQLYTRSLTILMENDLRQVNTEDGFLQFLEKNRESFSYVREKARYYFCKYLLYYIDYYIDQYFEGNMKIREYLVFNSNRFKAKDKKEFEQIPISMSGIYNAFNYYFFSYTDSDWMEVLIEYYGDINKLPEDEKRSLAKSLRAYNTDWKHLQDEAVIKAKCAQMEEDERMLDLLYATGKMDTPKPSRSGEKMIRQILIGEVDLNKTSLICYLLFFGSVLEKDNPMYLTRSRINKILVKCGFSRLREENEFDRFVLGFINAPNQVDYLMNTVTEYAKNEKNFYLYHMYSNTYSNQKLFERYIGN